MLRCLVRGDKKGLGSLMSSESTGGARGGAEVRRAISLNWELLGRRKKEEAWEEVQGYL
jgi:hypothetical protein